MSTLSTANPTLLDFTRELGPDGKVITDIAEVLEMQNPILKDMVVTEGNLTTGHKFLMRTGTALPTWMKVNGYINPTKSTTIPVQQSCGRLAQMCEIDPELADLGGNRAAFVRNQEVGAMQGMNDEMAETLFSGNESTEPEAFTGFGPYYNLSTGNENSDNVLKFDDNATTNSDIWLVKWSPTTIHGFFPKGTRAGLEYKDHGEQIVSGPVAGSRAVRLVSTFDWRLGLAIEDWRFAARAHFGYTLADTYLSAGTGKSLPEMMISLEERIPAGPGVPVFYMSRKGMEYLRNQILKKVSNNLTYETVAGKPVTMFDGIPVVRTDAILNNQSALAA